MPEQPSATLVDLAIVTTGEQRWKQYWTTADALAGARHDQLIGVEFTFGSADSDSDETLGDYRRKIADALEAHTLAENALTGYYFRNFGDDGVKALDEYLAAFAEVRKYEAPDADPDLPAAREALEALSAFTNSENVTGKPLDD